MKVTVDGYPLELSVVGGALTVTQEGTFRGFLSLAAPPADPEPEVLDAEIVDDGEPDDRPPAASITEAGDTR